MTWEINGKLILGVLPLKELSNLTGFKNNGISKKIYGYLFEDNSWVPFTQPPTE